MKNKRNVLYSLIIILAGVFYFTVQAQQKNGTQRTNFSGEWKSKESISMGGNIVCVYADGDRMRSKTMKIAQQAGFLTIEVPNQSPDAAQTTSQEKLAFNGKAGEIDFGWAKGKKFTAKLSADGQTMTVNSVVHLMVAKPYHVDAQEQLIVNVTEVWTLSNDGESISVQTNAKSNSFGEGRSWTTVFERI